MKYLLMPPIICLIILVSNRDLYGQDYPLETVVQMGHTDSFTTTFSPDGKYIVTLGGDDHIIKLWDVQTGKEIRAFPTYNNYTSFIEFSDDGRYFESSLGRENNWLRWDLLHSDSVRTVKRSYSDINKVRNIYLSLNYHDDQWHAYIKNSSNHEIRNEIIPDQEDFFNIFFNPDGKKLAATFRNKLIIYETDTGIKLQEYTGRHFSFSKDWSILGVASGDEYSLWDAHTGTRLHTLPNQSNQCTYLKDIKISQDSRWAATICDGGVWLYEVATGKLRFEIREYNQLGSATIEFSPDNKYLVHASLGEKGLCNLIDLSTGQIIRQFSGRGASINSISLSADGRYIASGGSNNAASLWDLFYGKMIQSFSIPEGETTSVSLSPDGKKLAAGNSNNNATIWNTKSGELINLHQTSGVVSSVTYSRNEKLLAIGNMGGTILWDVQKNKKFKTLKQSKEDEIFSIDISPNSQLIATGSWESRLWDIQRGRSEILYDGFARAISFSSDGNYLAVGADEDVKIWDVANAQHLTTIGRHSLIISALDFSNDGKLLASGSWDGMIKIWKSDFSKNSIEKEANSKEFKHLIGHTSRVLSVQFNQDGSQLLSAGIDGIIRVWDVNSGTEIIRMVSFNESDYAIVTPDGYYSASKGAMQGIHFVKGLEVFSFDNFDLIFNRPDIILERLGYADQELIDAYKRAYLKRLNKMGFVPNDISIDMHLPEIRLVDNELPLQSKDKFLVMKIQANDSKYLLDRINIYVNDVPIFGTAGISVKNEKVSSISKEVTIELSNGENNIQLSVHNEKGVESLKKSLKVEYTGLDSIPDIYFIGFGVSKFKEEAFNLTYADKDSNDILEMLRNSGHLYDEISSINLTNEMATRENFMELPVVLEKSKVDDMVILFVASHGLLDKDLDYYIGTHDVDFNNPKEKGLRYDELEDLMDVIPARNKLILLDACHSGEVDKEDLLLGGISEVPVDGKVKFRGFNTVSSKEERLGLQNSFELMRGLFADLRQNNGAVVISSASGQEFAYESDEWQNGLFTYNFLEGLLTDKADLNGDGVIKVYEIQKYVSKQVNKLSGGKQNPTNRIENLQNNFRIW